MSFDSAAETSTGSDDIGESSRASRSVVGRIWVWGVRLLRTVVWIVSAPILLYLSLRRSMTVASVVALLTLIMTMNVIWGFPWSGMMGGCLAVLIGGWAINRLMRPRLSMSLTLPRSAIAGQPFSVAVRLVNRRFFPALDLRIGWHREGVRDIYASTSNEDWDASPPVSVTHLRSGDQLKWQGSMRFYRRGIRKLPPFQVTSSFPFYLFHDRCSLATDTEIAITPAPLSADDDPMARVMLSAVGDWAKQLVAGAPVEYVGNREYEVGMHVRRWDFASWARLGRPIVREYQSPSIQAVTLILDTSEPSVIEREPRAAARTKEWLFERLLSLAATAVVDISNRRVRLQLRLTSDEPMTEMATPGTLNNEGSEPMLVRLAGATSVEAEQGQRRLIDLIDASRSQPILLMSLYDLDAPERRELFTRIPPNVTYLPVSHETGDEHRRLAPTRGSRNSERQTSRASA